MRIDRLRHALGFRLAVWYFGIFVGSTTVIIVLTYLLLATSLEQRDREAVRELVVRYAAAYTRGGTAAVDRLLESDRLSAQYEPFFLRVVTQSRAVVYVTLPPDWSAVAFSRLDAQALAAGEWLELTVGAGQAPLDVAGVRLADGTLMQAGKSSAMRREALARFRASATFIFFIVVAAALAGGAVLTRSALVPLRALTATIRDILRTGNIRTRVPVERSSDPLDVTASLFNELLARLETLIDGMRQALDNVAHDLRSPLTRLRSHAEAVLQGPPDVEAYRSALEDTLEETDRIAVMLTTLMDISEAQTGAMQLQRSPVSVRVLFDETLDLYGDAADARGVTLEADAPADLVVSADYNRLRQVVANLVDNAIKYTPTGGRIRLSSARDGAFVEISVADTGVGVPANELPRIWERLFRGDRSRSERGLGLGLSLVKAIVEAHGGTIQVKSDLDAGSTFILRLPSDDLSRM